MTNILVVEDNAGLRRLIGIHLRRAGYEVSEAADGQAALDLLEHSRVHLIITDVMMPRLDGYGLIRELREAGDTTPVLMVTVKDSFDDMRTGFHAGADDYLTKPFNPLELVARVKTQLRRSTRYNQPASAPAEVQEYDFRGLQISKTNHKCILFGDELSLTPLEFSILWYLCQHRGAVVSSEELFQAVWGERYMDGNNTVMTHIARLREKMHEPSRKPKFIKTVWGVGYTIE